MFSSRIVIATQSAHHFKAFCIRFKDFNFVKGRNDVYYGYGQYMNRAMPMQMSGKRTMIIRGHGRISVEPTKTRIQMEVVTENEHVTVAQQENTQKMNAVLGALSEEGIPEEVIQTTSYYIVPMYDYVDGKQILRGYEVSNTITLEVVGMEETGRILDVAVEHGVNRVVNVELMIEDGELHYRRALQEAIRDAQEKAQTVAEAWQINYDPIPGKIIEREIEIPQTFQPFMLEKADSGAATTPIQPGTITVSADIDVHFHY